MEEDSKIRKELFEEIINEAFKEQSVPKPEPLEPEEEQPKDWKDLQVKVKQIYLNLGCDAIDDKLVKGIRTNHKIDVFVNFNFGGQDYRIIIECKHWNSRVEKAQVGTLLGVISDIGAEKGIIVSKKGFQAGAHKLATYTNIALLTYDELLRDSSFFIHKFKLMNAKQKIKDIKTPFLRFFDLMIKEAEAIGEWWYPSQEGYALLGLTSILEFKIESLNERTYPTGFVFGSLRKDEKEIWKSANNEKEYVDFILENTAILEYEFETLKEKIFS